MSSVPSISPAVPSKISPPISLAAPSKISPPISPTIPSTCGEMSGAVDTVDEGKKPLEEYGDGTHLNSEHKQQIACFASTLYEQDPDVEKTQHAKKPAGDDSGEKTQMPTNTAEHTCLMVVPGEENDSNNLQMKKKKVKKRKRSELRQIKKEQQFDGAEKTQVPADVHKSASKASWRWHASYSSRLHHKYPKKVYNGLILLDDEVNRAVLLDTKEIIIDSHLLKEGEQISQGSVFEFPCHNVEIGKQLMNRKRLEKKRLDRNWERTKELRRKTLTSPQAKLVRSSIGTFARVASIRKEMSPQAQRRKLESPSVPNITVHFPSPNLSHVEADFTRFRPRKLKSQIWKEFIPIYEHGKVVEGRCKHCNEVVPASKVSGTNHVRRHLKKCPTRTSMHEMVAKMRASTSSPQVVSLDNWNFSQKESRRALANMIVQHGLPFSIVEYSGFIKFVKSLNPMFKMVSRTTIKDDCLDSYKEQRSLLRETLKNCGARVSLTTDMWTSNQRLGYLCVTYHFIDKTWKMQKRILRFCMMENHLPLH